MCEFCTQHGEGKKWYLNARNYATDLLDNLERRKFIGHFYHETIVNGHKQLSFLEKRFFGSMLLPPFIRKRMTRRSQAIHFGQVIPLEEIPRVLDMTNSITRVACGCRWAAEKKESRVCYGLSTGPPHWHDLLDMDFFGSPDVARMESISKEEAYQDMAKSERQGMVYSLWTFDTPFIGAICNCDGKYCLAMRSTVGQKMPVMFRAEYIAGIDAGKCDGCKACQKKCQFSAIRFLEDEKRCEIDSNKCYGCGVCRVFCKEDAIQLTDRAMHPVAAQLWV